MEILEWSYRRIALLDVPVMLDWYNNRELHETANAKTFHPYTIEELTKYWQKKINRTDASYFAIFINERMIGRVSLKGMDSTGEGIEYAIPVLTWAWYRDYEMYVGEIFLRSATAICTA
ncbi:hypothetical protein AB4114_05055 [Paenibacillus sp. 2RAB27]|uniref:hypothetical protein n=1 Tax=Paenibacillus sp. 2RAB27 TaxID=3232991 RepID=UPI003F9D36E7